MLTIWKVGKLTQTTGHHWSKCFLVLDGFLLSFTSLLLCSCTALIHAEIIYHETLASRVNLLYMTAMMDVRSFKVH